jgi:hypothetical protein
MILVTTRMEAEGEELDAAQAAEEWAFTAFSDPDEALSIAIVRDTELDWTLEVGEQYGKMLERVLEENEISEVILIERKVRSGEYVLGRGQYTLAALALASGLKVWVWRENQSGGWGLKKVGLLDKTGSDDWKSDFGKVVG